ncbi:hypothetical protein GAY31_18900 [Azospirillum brasilense]|nr:hypothetical protein [Azospirillum brasilense]
MCQFATPECGHACRAIRLVREHSRGPVGLDARAYLIRVERRLMQFHCGASLGIPTKVTQVREAAE